MLKTRLFFIPFFLTLTLSAQNVRFNVAAGCSPVAQSLGGIDVTLTPSKTPLTVANFMTYVNSGAYTCTLIHRSTNMVNNVQNPPYVIQGGGYILGPGNVPQLYTPINPPVTNEFSASNTAGTLAMGQSIAGIDSATNQWYFNTQDNSAGLDPGKYTVFGTVANDSSFAVMTNVNALPTFIYNAGNSANFADLPLYNYSCPSGTCGLIKPANYIFVTSIATIGAPAVSAAGVADAATALNNNKTGISPGEIITFYGANFGSANASYMGPVNVQGIELNSAGNVITNLESTQVTFNGVPGAMVFSSDQQIAVVAPYEIAGQSTVNVVVSYLGGSSGTMTFNVAPTTPGLFTLTQAGQGDAAIVRLSDASVISKSNPASVGDTLELYGEGYGAATANTALPDGAVVNTTLPVPAAKVTLLIDGTAVPTIYAGGAGGDVNGVMQINFKVPQLTPGTHQLQIQVGSTTSPAGVTLQTM